jgi:hypothetical protein
MAFGPEPMMRRAAPPSACAVVASGGATGSAILALSYTKPRLIHWSAKASSRKPVDTTTAT